MPAACLTLLKSSKSATKEKFLVNDSVVRGEQSLFEKKLTADKKSA